jgi:asparagine synthase (glutamine-hydrolysing)
MPMLQGDPDAAPRKWGFVEKWILRQAVRPYITDELYLRKKSQYNVPISRPVSKEEGEEEGQEQKLTPLQVLLKTRLTRSAVARLGWADWDFLGGLLAEYLEAAEAPLDGGLDKRARVLLCVLSFVIMQERFGVPTAVV